jgi:hypothetical protein
MEEVRHEEAGRGRHPCRSANGRIVDRSTGSPTFEPAPLGPDESCVFAVRFWPSEQFLGLKQDQRFLATATDPLTGEVLDSDTFVFLAEPRDDDSKRRLAIRASWLSGEEGMTRRAAFVELSMPIRLRRPRCRPRPVPRRS